MASIEKYTKNGKDAWLVRYGIMVNGKRQQRSKSGFTKEREARAFANRIEGQIVDREYVDKSSTTLAEYIDFYLNLYCTGLAAKTVESYTDIGKQVKTHSVADMALQRISPEDIQLYLKELVDLPRTVEIKTKTGTKKQERPPLSANSALHYFRFINLVFERAIKNKKISSNPCRHVIKPKIKKHQHIILSQDEYAKLLQSTKGKPFYIPILLGGFMGMRRGEVLGLTWADIDFKAQTLSIRQTRQVADREEILADPKTEKSRRVLHMPAIVANELKEHKNNIVIDISHQLVCSETTGEPISINTFTRRHKRALKAAGLSEDIRFHDLRHSAAALLTAAGASPKEVSDYLGHANIGISMDLYADIFEQSKKDTAQKLEALLRPLLKE